MQLLSENSHDFLPEYSSIPHLMENNWQIDSVVKFLGDIVIFLKLFIPILLSVGQILISLQFVFAFFDNTSIPFYL